MLSPQDLLSLIRNDEEIAYALFVGPTKAKDLRSRSLAEQASINARRIKVAEWLQKSDTELLRDLEVLTDRINKCMLLNIEKLSKHEQLEIADGITLHASIIIMIDDTQVNPMVLLDTLGAGGKGKVKKALNLNTGEFSAIKISPQTSITDADPSREMRTLKIFNRLHGQQERDAKFAKKNPGKKTYIQQEMINGIDLDKYTKSLENVNSLIHKTFVESKPNVKSKMAKDQFKFTLYILTIALFELSKLHANNLVHTDIKPANIMYDFSGIRLIDFGGVTKEGMITDLSSTTRSFLPPEIVKQIDSNHRRTVQFQAKPSMDIYALGITFKVILDCFLDSENAWNKFLNFRCQPAQTYLKEVNDLIETMLHAKPEQRISAPAALQRMHSIMTRINTDKAFDFGSLSLDVSEYSLANTRRLSRL